MHFSTLFAAAGLVASVAAGLLPRDSRVTVTRPHGDSAFPNVTPEQEQQIAIQAGGKLPGAPLPTKLGPGSTTAFQLIAFNELFEVRFFESLLYNVTNGVAGYKIDHDERDEAVKIIKTVLAQEKQHALGAIATLKSAAKFAPSPCKYRFPVNTLKDAIFLAETFTAIVLGALQDANVVFSKEGLPEVVRLISSVIGQEGEQNGFYRVYLNQVPSESPFLTTVPAAFAWSALQGFVVPGTCKEEIRKIDLPIFPPLLVNNQAVAKLEAEDRTLTFSATLKASEKKRYKDEDLYITYITGQQLPYSVEADKVEWEGNTVTLKAEFPFSKLIAQGFTHAALTTSGSFSSPDDVVSKTLAAPGVIQVQNPLPNGGKDYSY
ncbi:hypothetical protein F66182_2940 [Fusarium sp. NRRL 66182]|nr:hypothetical protein F66182_2940 [Fusarium sp. NRRL 66182]